MHAVRTQYPADQQKISGRLTGAPEEIPSPSGLFSLKIILYFGEERFSSLGRCAIMEDKTRPDLDIEFLRDLEYGMGFSKWNKR